MLLHKISLETTAYQLAFILASRLSLKVELSKDASPDAHFEFDPDRGIVFCSDKPISAIAEEEASDCGTAASYSAVLDMATAAVGSSANVPESVLYAVFSCLHEFGHYEQSLEYDRSELEQLAEQRGSSIEAAKAEAQQNADNGMPRQHVYSIFADRYRKIPIENDADVRALKMLARLITF